jgi:HTH-type transcriptional regulator / antitoxin HigA
MTALKYKIIGSLKQYHHYCKELESLLAHKSRGKEIRDEIDLLTLLVEKWDAEHSTLNELDPIALLQELLSVRKMKAVDLVQLLDVSKGLVSDILNYKKGLSKSVIRKLASEFKVSQEAFNRPYKLKNIRKPSVPGSSTPTHQII